MLAHNLIGGGGLSVGRNITALLPKLIPQNDYLMFVPYGLDYDLHKDYKNVTVHEIKRMGLCRRLHFERYALPKQISEFQADWILGLGNIGLLKPKCRQAILIHQPQILYGSKHYGKVPLKERIKFLAIKRWVKHSLKSTQIVFCQTPVMKKRFSKKNTVDAL